MRAGVPLRVLFLVPAGVSLLFGLDAGLFRIGWALPLPQLDLPLAHGPLMVSAFLGTLIGLEKAVAIGRSWAYLGPLSTGIGGIGLAVSATSASPRLLFVAGSAVLVALTALFFRRFPTLAHGSMLAGAALWLAGNALWLSGAPLYAVTPAWIGFLALTIAGERVELNRILKPSSASLALFVASGIVASSGALLASFGFASHPSGYSWGARLLGAGLLALGAWLLSSDLARIAVRKPGLSRFMGSSLLLGYVWLAVSGALFLLRGGLVSGELYDACLHSFFLGFVFSMVFAHGPIIFPAILGRAIAFHRGFYLPVAVLHAGLVLRLAGDLAGTTPWRRWGGLGNAIAILLFMGAVAAGVVKGGRESDRTAAALHKPRSPAA